MTVSCKNFLSRKPLDQPSAGNFWTSQRDVKMALTGCYNWLDQGGAGFGAYSMQWATLSDNAWNRSNSNQFQVVAKGEIQPTTGGIIYNAYHHYYQAIATANNFIANANKNKIQDISQSQMTNYIAQVHFLRAYWYFRLSELYGGVPLILKPVSYSNINKAKVARSSKSKVIAQVIKDLNFAIAHLPDKPYAGHVVKGSALGLKARVLLYNGDYQGAAQAAEKVINSGTFHLAKSYPGLFLKPSQNNNPEIMFSARYQLPNMYSNLDYHYGWQQWELVQPFQDLVNAYEMKNGKPINAPNSGYDPQHPYKNRDPRLRMTLIVPGDHWWYLNGTFEPSQDGVNQTGYLPRKYIDTTRAPFNYSTRSNQDWVILRYAEVLLDYAEAKNETAGPVPSVYKAIDEVRARPDVNMPPLPKGLSKEQMRQRIHRERRVELALEGQRYFDLKRWNEAQNVLSNVKDPGGNNRKFTKYNYLWPIPQQAMNKNPKLKQNPGY